MRKPTRAFSRRVTDSDGKLAIALTQLLRQLATVDGLAVDERGDLAYTAVDVTSSVQGMVGSVLKPGTWSLFRNISSDFEMGYRQMSGGELLGEGLGIVDSAATAAGVETQCKL